MKIPKISILALLVFSAVFVFGQTIPLQLVGSAGETFKTTNSQLDWSIGELSIETYTTDQNSLTQGFHQGKYIVTSAEMIGDSHFIVSVFPNPASDFLILRISDEKTENYRFSLADLSGRILLAGKLTGMQQQIDLKEIASGTYFLNIQSGQVSVKTFKVVKIKQP